MDSPTQTPDRVRAPRGRDVACLRLCQPGPVDDAPIDVVAAGEVLADSVQVVLASWVRSCVARFDVALADSEATAVAARCAVAEVMPALRSLLSADIDDQRGTPLTIVRAAVLHPTAVLAAAGVAPVVRDAYEAAAFPNDVYALTPATWADVHEELADAGLRWSVAKAFEHGRRHRGPGT